MSTSRTGVSPHARPTRRLPSHRGPRVTDAAPAAPRWLSLGPASRMVGVDPDTLRRWADEGRIEAYVTPGGHRRFDRQTIEALVSARRAGSRPLASLGASPERLTRAYRRSYTGRSTARDVPADDDGERELLPARRPAPRRGARRAPGRRCRRRRGTRALRSRGDRARRRPRSPAGDLRHEPDARRSGCSWRPAGRSSTN